MSATSLILLVLHSCSFLMHLHGSRHIFVLLLVCHVCCCASFHPHVIHVRLTLELTLTGIDYACDRRWKAPFNMVAELALGDNVNHERDS